MAVAFALEYPQRVESLILVDPGVGGGRGPQFPAWALPVMWTPQMRHVGQLMVRDYAETRLETIQREWFDQSKLTDEIMQDLENLENQKLGSRFLRIDLRSRLSRTAPTSAAVDCPRLHRWLVRKTV